MNVGKHGKIYGDQVSIHKKHLCKFLFEVNNSTIVGAIKTDSQENHEKTWDPVDTTLVILTLVGWMLLLVVCFNKFVDVLAYHAIRNESQIDKNYRKYLHARVQIVKPSERRNAFVIENKDARDRRSSEFRRSQSEIGDDFDDLEFMDCQEFTVF
ncbi:Oidioi.mRNA.OKI2018_I69.chr1.g848.t1.cds [Oikopleura dioica]|uniref:Oidioi.mRNA.OKI2018_I69.chr1.g833.t1.cds n=1 Tax=Oikopleura dioica TaxID=34765 RepID=A0ABN7SQG7_OIKDI|nr:Oidioi.mRNA.OKI2018_I69.chr1.g833.t1.cds [Oikopleura dioica]CAG5103606.1 Oidioi.mRNA.OKI2018_I69.chr1.g848.t1.cds [Oikopleura dioica]